MRLLSLLGLALTATVLSLAPAQANSKPKLISQHGHWGAYTYNENGGKVCFMASSPRSAKGNYTSRGDIFALITHRTSDKSKDVVSFVAGYTFKNGSDVTVTIDGKKHTLFTNDDTAWASDDALDKRMAAAIRNGNRMVVKGRSSRGTLTTDTYSLKGSTAAYNAITKACR